MKVENFKTNLKLAKKFFEKRNVDYKYISDHELVRLYTACMHLDSAEDIDIMWHIFGLNCGGYNGEIDYDIFNVLCFLFEHRDNVEVSKYVDNIAKNTGLDPKYVELIQYIICSSELADYGTSPRGCFLTDLGLYVTLQLILADRRLKEKESD